MFDPQSIETITKGVSILANAQNFSALNVIVIIVTISILFVATAYPVVKMIKRFISDKDTEITKSEAESLLYAHLVEQITETKEEFNKSRSENVQLWEIIRKLEARISRLEVLRAEYELLKKILASKEAEIVTKNSQIANLEKEISRLEERILDLELKIEKMESEN
jgi:cell shape-determining protein MreC